MIDKTKIQDVKERFDLLSYAGQRSELRKVAADEWAGPCPICGGDDRFRVKADGWFCAHCTGRSFIDAIELVKMVEHCSFSDALARMAGNAISSSPASHRLVTSDKKKQQPTDWADKAVALLETAQNALYSESDKRGAEYLTRRGLTPATWRRYGLGYKTDCGLPGTWNSETKTHSHPKQPAIVIPWYVGKRLVAIRYRFLEQHTYTDANGKQQTNKQNALFGSEFAGRMFGGQAMTMTCEDKRTLIICEGETNAMSIYQVSGETKVDVLSMGSESSHLTTAMASYARRFKHVMIWADEPDIAKNLMAALPGAFGVHSKALTGAKQDANDLLRAGHLGGYLTAWRFQMCKSQDDRLALYYDLFDAAYVGNGLDDGTLQVMASFQP